MRDHYLQDNLLNNSLTKQWAAVFLQWAEEPQEAEGLTPQQAVAV
jgi:hypothetical protein